MNFALVLFACLSVAFAFNSVVDTAKKTAGYKCVSKMFPVDAILKSLAGPAIEIAEQEIKKVSEHHGYKQANNIREGFAVRHHWFNLQLKHVMQTTSTDQVVILGCGFDTRSFTEPCLQHKTVYEVDFYDLISYKNRVIKRNNYAAYANVKRISFDLSKHGLMKHLVENGFDTEKPAVYIYEGLLCYLSDEMKNTLLRLPLFCSGSTLLMDITSTDLQAENCEAIDLIKSGIDDPHKHLRRMGFREIVLNQMGDLHANFGALDTLIPNLMTGHWGYKYPLRVTEVDGVPIQRFFLVRATSN
jgi:methyltransferase (TIGR00027 family)